jgi:lipid II:glycine glycyltransferase (peptidoglycan interpeptide bridge formation enzyme)
LRNEYACRRGFLLRLNPAIFAEDSEQVLSILADEGFVASASADAERTIVIDLDRSLDELRAGMRPHSRRQLRMAEKQDLTIVAGTWDELFRDFVEIYKEMVRRKQFPEPNDINEFRAMQHRLSDRQKMRVFLCRSSGVLCAGLICSILGETAVYLFGATSNAGSHARGSYLLHWRVMESLKAEGVAFYDLHGVNPVRNPGGYRFKNDLSGENGRHHRFIGRFDCGGSFLSDRSVTIADALRRVLRSTASLDSRLTHKAERKVPTMPIE